MDNIIIRKIWADTDFYETEIMFRTEFLHCKLNSYIVNTDIGNLKCKLDKYVNESKNFIWEIGENGSSDTPKVVIKSTDVNKHGYAYLEIFCNTFSDVDSKYGCLFPLQAEIGSLQRFATNLCKLNIEEVGTTIELL